MTTPHMYDQEIRRPQFQRHVVEALQVSARQDASIRAMAANAQIEVTADVMARGLVAHLRTFIHGMGGETISVHERWPADWLQAFKERWFPVWALKRWPVAYRRIDIEERLYAAVCPHIADPERRTHLEWLVQTTEGEPPQPPFPLRVYGPLLHKPWRSDGLEGIRGFWAEDDSLYMFRVPHQLRDMLVALQNELCLAYRDQSFQEQPPRG